MSDGMSMKFWSCGVAESFPEDFINFLEPLILSRRFAKCEFSHAGGYSEVEGQVSDATLIGMTKNSNQVMDFDLKGKLPDENELRIQVTLAVVQLPTGDSGVVFSVPTRRHRTALFDLLATRNLQLEEFANLIRKAFGCQSFVGNSVGWDEVFAVNSMRFKTSYVGSIAMFSGLSHDATEFLRSLDGTYETRDSEQGTVSVSYTHLTLPTKA